MTKSKKKSIQRVAEIPLKMVNEYPFGSLPMEMKEMVLQKIAIKDSLKLLQVNRQLRNYVLYWGPFYKKIIDQMKIIVRNPYVEPKLTIDGQKVWINLSEQFFPFTGHPHHFLNYFSRELRVKLLKSIVSLRSLSIHFKANLLYDFDISLRDFLPQVEYLEVFRLHANIIDSLKQVLAIIQPKVSFRFDFRSLDGNFFGRLEADSLKSMLRDCTEVIVNKGYEPFYKVLQETNVQRILINIDNRDPRETVLATLANGVPSKHPMAVLHLRADQIWMGEILRALRDTHFCISPVSFSTDKRIHCATMIKEAFRDQRFYMSGNRVKNLDIFKSGDDCFYFVYHPKPVADRYATKRTRDEPVYVHFSVMEGRNIHSF